MVTLPIVPSLFLSLLILPVPIVAETQNFLRFQRRLALQPNFIQLGSNEYPLNNSRVLAKREADGSRLYKPLPLSAKDSDFIVAEHNKYRRMVG